MRTPPKNEFPRAFWISARVPAIPAQAGIQTGVGSGGVFASTVPKPVPTNPRTPSGFTLVELMVVIVIIAMLATMSILVVGQVQHTARVHTTEARIARLDHIMTEIYESYMYRQMPVPGSTRIPADAARIRLLMIYDTMRMEMPNTWVEALSKPQISNLSDSALRQVYERAFTDAEGTFERNDSGVASIADNGQNDAIKKNQEAKLLYLVIMNTVPEARDMVGEKGIETDESGLSYFVDGWGNPIHFLRWAPAFTGSDRQPDLWKWTNSTPNHSEYEDGFEASDDDDPNVVYWEKHLSPDIFTDEQMASDYQFEPQDWQKNNIRDAIRTYPDPFDPVKARRITASNSNARRPGFLLVPLIFSAGADGEPGIKGLKPSEIYNDPFARGIGAPEGNTGYYYDNIHNHTLGGR